MNTIPYRQIHLDFHTSPDIPEVGSAFDSEQFVEILKSAQVESINLFAKCHHGWAYYPTTVGKMHPNLAFDLLGAQIQVCRQAGIRPNVYYTVGFSERDADEHPDWVLRDREGNSTMGYIMGAAQARSNPLVNKQGAQQYFGSIAFWRYMCVNNPAYVAQIKLELAELIQAYNPPGLWLDIIMQSVCVCSVCRAEMQAMGMSPENDLQVAIHGRMVEIRFFKEMRAFVDGIAPGTDLYINGFGQKMDLQTNPEISAARKVEAVSLFDIESLPSVLWEYVHFPIHAQYFNKPAFSQPLTMMSGRFHRLWGDFGGLKNLEAMEYEAFRALAYGCRVCIGDQMLPDGRLDSTVYRQIGRVFSEIKQRQPWCEGATKQAQIGVFLDNQAPGGPGLAVEGAFRMLTELHHQFDLIDFMDDLTRYELLILPDRVRLPPEAAKKLQDYLSHGGAVLLTDKSGLKIDEDQFALNEFGLHYVKEAEFAPRYLHLEEHQIADIPPMDYVMYQKGSSVEAYENAVVLANITNPWFNRSPKMFSSHLHTPPARLTDEPCIVRQERVIYVAQPLFTDYANVGNRIFRQVIAALIDNLLPTPLVTTDLPVTAECLLWKKDGALILHVVSYIIQKKCKEMEIVEERFPLFQRQFKVKCDRRPLEVKLVPQNISLDFEYKDGYVIFRGDVEGYQLFEITQEATA